MKHDRLPTVPALLVALASAACAPPQQATQQESELIGCGGELEDRTTGLENELERIERDWADECEAHMIRRKDGTLEEPRSQEPWIWLTGEWCSQGIYAGIEVESAGFGLLMTLLMSVAL